MTTFKMLKVFSLLSGVHASTFLSVTRQLLKREQELLRCFWFLQESISANQELRLNSDNHFMPRSSIACQLTFCKYCKERLT